jgi:hypothetical protein
MARLRTARRHVPLDRGDDYMLAWAAARRAVEAAGGRAWLFHGAGHEDQFMEFIEWDDATTTSPLLDSDAAAAIAQLDAFAPASQAEEWEETA